MKWWAAAALVAALVAAGCASDGRELRPPPPGATAPPLPTTTLAAAGPSQAPAVDNGLALTLTSPAFTAGGALPARHTCEGEDLSPPLQWSGVPAGTVELALTVVDLDAGGFVNWALAGIDPAVTALDEGAAPEGSVEAVDTAGEPGWSGPCPPPGATHGYLFTLYALTQPSDVTPGTVNADAVARLAATPGTIATLRATVAAS